MFLPRPKSWEWRLALDDCDARAASTVAVDMLVIRQLMASVVSIAIGRNKGRIMQNVLWQL